MIDLERALTDLAGHLDLPASDNAPAELRRRLEAVAPDSARRRRVGTLLAAAAVFALVSTGVLAIAPARHAVANWLGIGAVEIRRSGRPPATGPVATRRVPGTPNSARDHAAAARLREARPAVRFTIATPRLAAAGALAGVDLDRRVPGGLVALTYPRFTLVEIATDAAQPSPIGKLAGNAILIEHLRVNGRPAIWVGGVHQIGFLDRSGRFRQDTLRRSGPVLLWERDGVTYRIEGLPTRTEALRVATSVR